MKTFQEVLEESRKRMAENRFTPKVKCAICFGRGDVACYPTFKRDGTGEIVRQPCQRCGGSGEQPAW